MRNSDVAIRFFEGATKGGVKHLFIEENVIYSYGHHFPIAIRLNDGEGYRYIFNSDGYSNTTAMHKGFVKRLIGDRIVLETNTQKLKELINSDVKDLKEIMLENLGDENATA